ncbi:nucleotide pyrophosphatase [Siculibacillus lacustris]|uniref:Nucleotide pyrophosphatase n=1 Tax=Siculibacillus lacustris TaxID=1549641 RepID=A0A4Q9VRB8_9HYPH|nr:nucleotide pyrophosphatase [Siculibacillus lacustris]
MVILDGLRRDFVDDRSTPHLAALRRRATWFASHRGVFPSVTRVSAASIATGCRPSGHGLAGNAVALVEDGRLAVHDVGPPEFVDTKRRLTGRVLDRPTLAERLGPHGGAVAISNVSPGAAYMLDPDGFGSVYHRAGSYGPGRVAIDGAEALAITGDGAGDAAATERFIDEVLKSRRPSLATLWLCEPDKTQHGSGLGGATHRAALAAADALAGRVIAAVAALRAAGEEILLVVGSDHGHETVDEVVDVEAELIAAGLKDGADSSDVVVAPNGTAALIYVDPAFATRRPAIGRFLAGRPWAGRVIEPQSFAEFGIAEAGHLAFAVSLAQSDVPNAAGVPGRSRAVKPLAGKSDRLGVGQHGGLGTHEQSPFLIVDGAGFAPGATVDAPTSIVDIAPTILSHLGLSPDGMDGRPLQTVPASRIS